MVSCPTDQQIALFKESVQFKLCTYHENTMLEAGTMYIVPHKAMKIQGEKHFASLNKSIIV